MPRGVGELVHEALGDERILGVADTAPAAERQAGIVQHALHIDVGGAAGMLRRPSCDVGSSALISERAAPDTRFSCQPGTEFGSMARKVGSSGTTMPDALGAASVQYRIAVGPHAGRKVLTLRLETSKSSSTVPKPFTVVRDGFSLHAAVAFATHEHESAERLCRYVPVREV